MSAGSTHGQRSTSDESSASSIARFCVRRICPTRRPSTGEWPKGSRSAEEPTGRQLRGGTSLGPGPKEHAVEREEQRREDESRDEQSLLHRVHSPARARPRLYG